MYIGYIRDMSEPVIEPMADVRKHLADVIGIDEYRRLRELEEQAEDSWLNRLADEAEAEGRDGSVSLEEMAALLRSHHA